MAIDTAEKRRSAAHISMARVSAGVTPNASPDDEWRAQVGRSYSGILPGGGPVAGDLIIELRRRRRQKLLRRRF